MGAFLEAFRSRRVAVMLFLGFASGAPNPVTGSTLTAWMDSAGMSLTTIGFFALVGLPYNLKFLWAPAMDRYRLPFLGRRRGWLIVTQLALLVAVGAMGTIEPRSAPVALAAMALAVAFLSASQDVVADAYRTDVLAPNERGSGTALWVAGYRLALMAAGAGALILSDVLPWRAVYGLLAALMLIGVAATLLSPEPEATEASPRTLYDAVVVPFLEFFRRRGSITLLVVVALYKVGDAIGGQLLTPFLLSLDFSRSEVGVIQKGLGLGATIVGALVGGGLIARFGLRRPLLVFGLLQAVANGLYVLLAVTGKHHGLLVAAIGVDNLMGGLGTAAFVAFLMALCDRRYTAFQYALLSALGSVVGRLLGGPGGVLAEELGWAPFFAITIVAALPALVLLLFVPLPDTTAQAR